MQPTIIRKPPHANVRPAARLPTCRQPGLPAGHRRPGRPGPGIRRLCAGDLASQPAHAGRPCAIGHARPGSRHARHDRPVRRHHAHRGRSLPDRLRGRGARSVQRGPGADRGGGRQAHAGLQERRRGDEPQLHRPRPVLCPHRRHHRHRVRPHRRRFRARDHLAQERARRTGHRHAARPRSPELQGADGGRVVPRAGVAVRRALHEQVRAGARRRRQGGRRAVRGRGRARRTGAAQGQDPRARHRQDRRLFRH